MARYYDVEADLRFVARACARDATFIALSGDSQPRREATE